MVYNELLDEFESNYYDLENLIGSSGYGTEWNLSIANKWFPILDSAMNGSSSTIKLRHFFDVKSDLTVNSANLKRFLQWVLAVSYYVVNKYSGYRGLYRRIYRKHVKHFVPEIGSLKSNMVDHLDFTALTDPLYMGYVSYTNTMEFEYSINVLSKIVSKLLFNTIYFEGRPEIFSDCRDLHELMHALRNYLLPKKDFKYFEEFLEKAIDNSLRHAFMLNAPNFIVNVMNYGIKKDKKYREISIDVELFYIKPTINSANNYMAIHTALREMSISNIRDNIPFLVRVFRSPIANSVILAYPELARRIAIIIAELGDDKLELRQDTLMGYIRDIKLGLGYVAESVKNGITNSNNFSLNDEVKEYIKNTSTHPLNWKVLNCLYKIDQLRGKNNDG